MFRKPEYIEYPALVFSFGCLLYIFFSFNSGEPAQQSLSLAAMRGSLVFTALCLAGEMFLNRNLFRVGALFLHLIVLLATLFALRGRFIIDELLLVSLFVLQSALRLSPLRGFLLNVLVLAGVTSIGAGFKSSFNDRVVVILLGLFWIFITGIIIFYREKLVEKSMVVDAQYRSLENLVAANHSFVEHLENVELESAEKERLRITRDLHDEIGYAMTNISMMMNASRGLLNTKPEMLLDYCMKTREIAKTTLHETRNTLYKLRDIDQKVTQNPAIFFTRLCQDFDAATGIKVECHTGNLADRLNDVVFGVLVRGVQVGFINALRHGNAGHIRLSFWINADELIMRIWNDTSLGSADSDVITKGIGLKGMYERLETVNGRLRFGAVTDGFEFIISIPGKEVTRAVN